MGYLSATKIVQMMTLALSCPFKAKVEYKEMLEQKISWKVLKILA